MNQRIQELNSEIQELTSEVYCIISLAEDAQAVSYYDLENNKMAYTLLMYGIECKLLTDVRPELHVMFGKFIEQIQSWERGEIEDFPFQVVLNEDEPDETPEIDGREGSLT